MITLGEVKTSKGKSLVKREWRDKDTGESGISYFIEVEDGMKVGKPSANYFWRRVCDHLSFDAAEKIEQFMQTPTEFSSDSIISAIVSRSTIKYCHTTNDETGKSGIHVVDIIPNEKDVEAIENKIVKLERIKVETPKVQEIQLD